jgi:hypothetical protein
MDIRGQLDAMGQPGGEITHKLDRVGGAPASEQPTRNKFGIRIEREPGPYITKAELAFVFFWYVLFPGVAEAPDFITLEPLTGQVAELLVLVSLAGRTKINEEFEHRAFRGSCHATGCPDTVPFNQCCDYLRPLFHAQSVHGTHLQLDAYIMLERLSNVKFFSEDRLSPSLIVDKG